LFFYSKGKHKYEDSVFITNSVAIDLNENKFSIAVEILDAFNIFSLYECYKK